VWTDLYDYAWFVSFASSFAVYTAWSRWAPLARSREDDAQLAR
jgi:cytosine/uracil/thiamine/allantoin permease